jgi:hypothetical protein
MEYSYCKTPALLPFTILMDVPAPSATRGKEWVLRFPEMEKGIAPGWSEQIPLGPVSQPPL